MVKWRKKATGIFPELRLNILNNKKYNTYQLFSDLKLQLEEAHLAKNISKIKKIYDFAEWCFHQKTQYLWNSAGVSFYEDIVKNDLILKEIPYWIKPSLFQEVKGLFEFGLSNKSKYRKFVSKYNTINKTNFK